MKILEELSGEEMKKKFPDLMNALGAEDSFYCDVCDGLRRREHTCICWVCRKPVNECKCLEGGKS